MILFDFLYLKAYHLLIKIKGEDGSIAFSAFLYTSFFMGCIILSVLSVWGLIFESKVAITVIKGSFLYFVSILALSAIILGIRYRFVKDLSKIREAYEGKSSSVKKRIDYLSYLFMLIIPILTFIVFRKLYVLY